MWVNLFLMNSAAHGRRLLLPACMMISLSRRCASMVYKSCAHTHCTVKYPESWHFKPATLNAADSTVNACFISKVHSM
mgnify:CR=1 FL=1